MEPISYTTVDKSQWGDGPWQAEPDKMQWTDAATGFPCLIVRGPMGALCGYVGVSEAHPAHGLSYEGIPDKDSKKRSVEVRKRLKTALAQAHEVVRAVLEVLPDRAEPDAVGEKVSNINVHGGLTFAGGCQKGGDPAVDICHVPEPGEPDGVWWFGFDCAHFMDFMPGHAARMREIAVRLPLLPVLPFDKDVYRDVPYVQGEVADLARQLAEIGQSQ